MANRFRLVDAGLQRINNQNKDVGRPINLESQQGELLMDLLDDPSKREYELIDENRMAGEAVDTLIKSLEGDVALEKALADAQVYIEARAPELQQLGLTKGGRSLADAEKILLGLGQMKGNVPMPLIENLATRQRRTHLQNQVNPVTGETEQIAVMDPMNTDKVMRSEFGMTPSSAGRPEILQADEIASEYALKLINQEVKNMPHKAWNRQRREFDHPADFKVINNDGVRRNIDSEQGTVGSTVVPMQVHTEVAGLDGNRVMSVRETQALLDSELAKGKNVIEAVDDLADRGELASNLAKVSGKVIRGDTSRDMHLNDRYHELIQPEYANDVRNAPINEQPRNIVIAPSGFNGVNLDLAARAIKAGQGNHPRVGVNRGGSRRGHKVNVGLKRDTKVNGENVFTDLTEVHPLIQQLLSEAEMEKRRVY